MDVLTQDKPSGISDYLDGLVARGLVLRGPRLRWVEGKVVKRFAVGRGVARAGISAWLAAHAG